MEAAQETAMASLCFARAPTPETKEIQYEPLIAPSDRPERERGAIVLRAAPHY